MKALFVIMLTFCIIFSAVANSAYSISDIQGEGKIIVGKVSGEIEIQPQSDYLIKFNIDELSLEGKNSTNLTSGFSDKIKKAIAKSPNWIQNKLAKQFFEINADDYADLILKADKKYVDEIAFTIAYSSIGNIPSVDLIFDNVLALYENDEWIEYADIVDYDDNQGNYYSTIKYKVLEEGIEKQFEYPSKIYYQYVVHPEIGSENAEYIYNEFWRDYLFNHNDIGYPLLKEKLSDIKYLWDCESYSQPGNRLWSNIIEIHPTAIEAISYWVGKTVPAQAFGDRPNQPNIIAHEHNGWCGELQKIAVAVQRSSLIPSVGIFNIGEDHVWREFYERGWHQNDNWWSDGGGTVDIPYVYALGWGKDMSSVFGWKGDDSIYEVTSKYIPNDETKTISFNVFDRFLRPVDGARVAVTVWGPNDITWLKYRLFQGLEDIWDSLPQFLQGRIIQFLFEKIHDRIDKIPNSVDGPIYSIWNYTNISGKCSFELGQNHSYLFIIQYGNLKKPLGLARHNKIKSLKIPTDKNYNIWLPALKPIKSRYKDQEIPSGEVDLKISFNTKSYQIHESILWIDDKGVIEKDGNIDFFIVDEDNFNKYKNGEKFDSYNLLSCEKKEFTVSTVEKDWYLIFRNNARNSNVILNYSVTAEVLTNQHRVQIVNPNRNLFDKPIYNIGDIILINGIATNIVQLKINEISHQISIEDNEWFYYFNTSNFEPGDYKITAVCGDSSDEILIKLIDRFNPEIKINYPHNHAILEKQIINIFGNAHDNYNIEKVDIKVDNSERITANGIENWSVLFDLNNLELGDHILSARAIDMNGCISFDNISIVVNESGHSWSPKINTIYHKPDYPTNVSNVIIYANVTKNNPFDIKSVIIIIDNATIKKSLSMFRYADFPMQERHEEDPLKNQSNEPIFGYELGQFPNGTIINYQIKAVDTANNIVLSDLKSFEIQD
ncbi:hypothetical protein AYK21_02335 [Thermoplasmatales archaeon SG8-52-2]|nr:MAG: hypothetical protein AYK21_02335 [Thermoplasmatales archaeon SG8-52-2]